VASTFTPITPCRLADTRPAPDLVGSRSAPVGAGETVTFAVWGTNGNCTIPSTATGVAMNATAVAPSAAGFVTIFPADAALPTTSNLNFVAGSPPTPNQVTVGLSTTGAIKAFNKFGSVALIIDIVGYYSAATTGPAGPAGATGATGATGARGFSAWDVIPSGVTVTGAYFLDDTSAGPGNHTINIAFPFKARSLLADTDVNFSTYVLFDSNLASDKTASCTGTYYDPTAPAGKVCIYMTQNLGISLMAGMSPYFAAQDTGFRIDYLVNVGLGEDVFSAMSWAYTAP
jgi:hypothetical protein